MAAAATAAANLRRSLFCGIETVMAIDISIYVWVGCRAGRHCKRRHLLSMAYYIYECSIFDAFSVCVLFSNISMRTPFTYYIAEDALIRLQTIPPNCCFLLA